MSNNNYNQGVWGASRIPSARRGIHDYRQSYLDIENMVRYGIDNGRDNNDSGESDKEGYDEPDNVMSKHAHPIGSPSRSKKRRHRRNSLRTENTYTEDEDINELSKSVPATLPSQLYYSSDSEDDQQSRNEYYVSDLSYHSAVTPNRSNASRTAYCDEAPQRHDSAQFAQKEGKISQCYTIIIVLSIVVLLVGMGAKMLSTPNESNSITYDEIKFYTDISSYGEKYNVDENSILQVQTGISTIFEKQDTGSFMFVYDSNRNNFNHAEFNEFVNDISIAASKYLRNDSIPIRYTMVEGTKLDLEEDSELIARYRDDLHQTGVMLVHHVEAVPSKLAMAFHYYCDEYNPLVKKSAIFFTLNLAQCQGGSDKKPFHAFIEKCLSKKWNSVPMDSIGPLLTRVVSVVIDVTSVFG